MGILQLEADPSRFFQQLIVQRRSSLFDCAFNGIAFRPGGGFDIISGVAPLPAGGTPAMRPRAFSTANKVFSVRTADPSRPLSLVGRNTHVTLPLQVNASGKAVFPASSWLPLVIEVELSAFVDSGHVMLTMSYARIATVDSRLARNDEELAALDERLRAGFDVPPIEVDTSGFADLVGEEVKFLNAGVAADPVTGAVALRLEWDLNAAPLEAGRPHWAGFFNGLLGQTFGRSDRLQTQEPGGGPTGNYRILLLAETVRTYLIRKTRKDIVSPSRELIDGPRVFIRAPANTVGPCTVAVWSRVKFRNAVKCVAASAGGFLIDAVFGPFADVLAPAATADLRTLDVEATVFALGQLSVVRTSITGRPLTKFDASMSVVPDISVFRMWCGTLSEVVSAAQWLPRLHISLPVSMLTGFLSWLSEDGVTYIADPAETPVEGCTEPELSLDLITGGRTSYVCHSEVKQLPGFSLERIAAAGDADGLARSVAFEGTIDSSQYVVPDYAKVISSSAIAFEGDAYIADDVCSPNPNPELHFSLTVLIKQVEAQREDVHRICSVEAVDLGPGHISFEVSSVTNSLQGPVFTIDCTLRPILGGGHGRDATRSGLTRGGFERDFAVPQKKIVGRTIQVAVVTTAGGPAVASVTLPQLDLVAFQDRVRRDNAEFCSGSTPVFIPELDDFVPRPKGVPAASEIDHKSRSTRALAGPQLALALRTVRR
jgi:hypothetical protein